MSMEVYSVIQKGTDVIDKKKREKEILYHVITDRHSGTVHIYIHMYMYS